MNAEEQKNLICALIDGERLQERTGIDGDWVDLGNANIGGLAEIIINDRMPGRGFRVKPKQQEFFLTIGEGGHWVQLDKLQFSVPAVPQIKLTMEGGEFVKAELIK